MVLPGLINLDFADVRTVMTEMGKAMMGTGEASGEDRALMAAQNAIANPLLDEITLKGAKAVLVNVTGGLDMTLLEVDEAANAISAEVDPEANIIFGAAFDPSLDGKIRVSVVATGMDGSSAAMQEQRSFRSVTAAGRKAAEAAPAAAPAMEEAAVVAAEMAEEPVMLDTPAEGWMFEEGAAAVAAPLQPSLLDDDMGPAKVEPLAAQTRSFTEFEPAEEEPLFPSIHPEERRPQKGGWLSLFGGGRPRYEAPAPAAPAAREPAREPLRERPTAGPVPQARTVASAQLAEAPQSEEGEDLNIPSFLRRLAN
jgi:cell division protein FtsZ